MKKLILFLFCISSLSAQMIEYGAKISVNYANFEKTYTSAGFWGETLRSNSEENLIAYSFSGDITTKFNDYTAATLELGLTFGSQSSNYYGIDVGAFYSTNKLFNKIYIKPGIIAHFNYTGTSRFADRTILFGSLGVGIKLTNKSSLECTYGLPLNKIYTKDFFTEFKLKNIFGLGLKLIF